MTLGARVYADPAITPAGGLLGYVTTSYADIVAMFGPANAQDIDPYKIDVEWLVQTPAGPARVYNWKPELPLSMAIEDITMWHVGGESADVVAHVADALEASAICLRWDPATQRTVHERITPAPKADRGPMTAAAARAAGNDLADHLLTGEPLFVPGARPDHDGTRNQALFFVPTRPIRLRRHPFNRKQTSVVGGRLAEWGTSGPDTWYVALAHLAHARGSCASCEAVWRTADTAWSEVPECPPDAHVSIFGALDVEPNAALLVHVDDLPQDQGDSGSGRYE